jgi:PAS domain S-box-containing protein
MDLEPDCPPASSDADSKDAMERLRRADERLRLAVEAARVGVWYVDYPFDKIRFSTGISRSFGLPPGGELTKEMLYSYVHPEDRPRVQRAFERSMAEGQDYDIEHRAVNRSNGEVRWIRAVGRCFRDRDGKAHHFDGIVWDITRKREEQEHLRRAQEQLRLAMENELAEATRLREQLLGIVSHDLKAPLTTISMAASLLAGHVPCQGERKNIELILRSVERMKRLIHQLLDFARIRACGGVLIDPRPIDLHAVCRNLVDECSVTHPRHTIVFESSGDGHGVWDGDRLAEAFSNLIVNAIQHGAGGSIGVRVLDEGEYLSIAIHNQGPPISPQVLPCIFDPYRQGQRRGETDSPSVGLGLYIVQQIVLAHGGQVVAKSPDGDGTTFTIRLPRHPSVCESSSA